ncbi:uncharacterized protein LOC131021829 isoform X3 [Salvia miltiorrhiza]|uniref:uncharacterized protein LOC131021829 isoform X3 n=1 Tax=Salvia miltiorrhiza TaxID=226208 RepID=UPI0025AB5F97|nr:uncharacterized protein LOC131021829 isoform X3 [Salvia miltiorrhiza]
MAVNSCEECQNVHSVVVLNDEGPTDQQYEPSSNINYSEVPKVMQSQLFLNSKPGLHNHTNLEVDDVNDYAPCVLDVDIEKGMAESLKSNVETVATLTSDDSLQKESMMQLLVGQGNTSDLSHSTQEEYFSCSLSCKLKAYPSLWFLMSHYNLLKIEICTFIMGRVQLRCDGGDKA